MFHAFKYLEVEDGVIALTNIPYNYFEDGVNQEDIALKVMDTCILISVKDLNIPIPDDMIDYITDNRTITVYSINNSQNNMESPIVRIEMPVNSMVEARGIYNYIKQEKSREQTTPVIMADAPPTDKASFIRGD